MRRARQSRGPAAGVGRALRSAPAGLPGPCSTRNDPEYPNRQTMFKNPRRYAKEMSQAFIDAEARGWGARWPRVLRSMRGVESVTCNLRPPTHTHTHTHTHNPPPPNKTTVEAVQGAVRGCRIVSTALIPSHHRPPPHFFPNTKRRSCFGSSTRTHTQTHTHIHSHTRIPPQKPQILLKNPNLQTPQNPTTVEAVQGAVRGRRRHHRVDGAHPGPPRAAAGPQGRR